MIWYMYTLWKNSDIGLISTSIILHICLFLPGGVRTFKFYSLTKFQLCNTVLSIIVSMSQLLLTRIASLQTIDNTSNKGSASIFGMYYKWLSCGDESGKCYWCPFPIQQCNKCRFIFSLVHWSEEQRKCYAFLQQVKQ